MKVCDNCLNTGDLSRTTAETWMPGPTAGGPDKTDLGEYCDDCISLLKDGSWTDLEERRRVPASPEDA